MQNNALRGIFTIGVNRMKRWYCVPKRALLLIAGIVWLAAGVFPEVFVAFFYTGLGCALALAGVLFCVNFIRY